MASHSAIGETAGLHGTATGSPAPASQLDSIIWGAGAHSGALDVAHSQRLGWTGDRHEAEWRECIGALGAQAAIVIYTTPYMPQRRHAFLIGLDRHRADARAAATFLDRAQHVWELLGDRASMEMRLQQLPRTPHPDLLGEFDHAIAAQTGTAATGQLRIVLMRTHDRGAFPRSKRAALSGAVPALAAAIAVQVAASRQQRRLGIVEGMLDQMSMAMFLVDPIARPFYRNGAAETMLGERRMLWVGSDGVLRCATAARTKALHAAISAATISNDRHGQQVLRIDDADGEQWLLGFVVPTQARNRDPENRAAMLLLRPSQSVDTPGAMFTAFGLLRCEQRFLKVYLESSSLAEAAAMSGLSTETARTYLKRICAKLGVRRQVELVSLIYGHVPPLLQPEPRLEAAE